LLAGKRVLVLGAHTDDAELGCGGTIARVIGEGSEVHVAAFSSAAESLPAGWPADTLRNECLAATGSLGVPPQQVHLYDYPVRHFPAHRQAILEDLVVLRQQIDPEVVFIHSGDDVHQDHHVIHEEGLRAFKERTVLAYELPWNAMSFSPQAFVTLEHEHVRSKWSALECYASQLHLARSYFSLDVVEGLARVRGASVKAMWAEAFEVCRVRY
jgi:LmbE family N-acetylglucosaminyl deacetylase